MKGLILGLLTALLVACSSGGGPRPEPQPQPPPEQAMDIVITDSRTDAGVPDVWVECGNLGWGHTNADGYLFRERVFSFEVLECLFQRDGYHALTQPFTPSPSDPRMDVVMERDGPQHPNPLQGRLRIEGGCFRDDTGCVNPIYAHAGDLFSVYVRDTARALRELDSVAAAGYHGLRVWSTLCSWPCPSNDYWAGRAVGPDATPDYWTRVESFFRDVQSRGLRLVWSQGAVNALGDRRQAMSRFAQLDNAVGGVIDFIDCANEGYGTGEPDPRKLAQCIGYYAEAGGRGLKSTTDTPIYPPRSARWADWVLPPSDVFDVHSNRKGHSWDKRRHSFNYGYENPPPLPFGISSEPPGNGWRVSVTDNKHELDEEAVALLALGSMLGRQAHVWFSGQGVILEGGLNQESGFYSTPRAVALLPRDVMTYQTPHHSGDRWRDVRILEAQGDVRIDCRAHDDGRRACTIDGPGGSYSLRVTRGFDGLLCHPGTGECEGVSRNAGDRLDVSFTRGRLLVGSLK